jgi:2-phosphoglycerate kinase
MEADKRELSEVYKELRKFTGAQDLDKWLADNSKAMLEEVKALIKRAVQEGQEAAIKYDSPRLLQRLLDKAKTKEQIKIMPIGF